MPSDIENCLNGSALPKKMNARAVDKKYLKTASPSEPLVQIQIILHKCYL